MKHTFTARSPFCTSVFSAPKDRSVPVCLNYGGYLKVSEFKDGTRCPDVSHSVHSRYSRARSEIHVQLRTFCQALVL